MSSFLTSNDKGKKFVHEIRSVQKTNRKVIDNHGIEELKEAFSIFDIDHKGGINCRELKAALRTIGHEGVTKK